MSAQAFYYNDAPYECATCREEDIDPMTSPKHEVTTFHTAFHPQRGTMRLKYTEDVCSGCVEMCSFCGEYLETANDEQLGYSVRFRDPVADGKLTDAHAWCAGTWLVYLMAGASDFSTFDLDHYSKDGLAAFVADRAQALEVAHAN